MSKTDSVSISQILLEAADLLEHKGWVQYTLERTEPPKVTPVHLFHWEQAQQRGVDPIGYCTRGAISMAAHGNAHEYTPEVKEALALVADHISERSEEHLHNNDIVTDWNDAPFRRKADVLNLLRKVAEDV